MVSIDPLPGTLRLVLLRADETCIAGVRDRLCALLALDHIRCAVADLWLLNERNRPSARRRRVRWRSSGRRRGTSSFFNGATARTPSQRRPVCGLGELTT